MQFSIGNILIKNMQNYKRANNSLFYNDNSYILVQKSTSTCYPLNFLAETDWPGRCIVKEIETIIDQYNVLLEKFNRFIESW